jgi:hypothetical protein
MQTIDDTKISSADERVMDNLRGGVDQGVCFSSELPGFFLSGGCPQRPFRPLQTGWC